MKKTQPLRTVVLCVFVLSLLSSAAAKKHEIVVRNPLLFADVPDPDVICVGKDYYMVSTTMHMSPGAPIMHSRDMKHWHTIGYVFEALHESPANNLLGRNVYGRGQWAASLRYHRGQFYVFFGTGACSYLYMATNPAGPWTLLTRFDRYYHDASLLFDTDDAAYLIHCMGGHLYLKQFRADLGGFVDGNGHGTSIAGLDDGSLHEGVHAYKVDDRYYLTTIWWPARGIRTQLCFRSDHITGPYERKVILSDTAGVPGRGVAQGGIWRAHNGLWYGMLFQDHDGVGRIPYLLPCTWIDGWPILGDSLGRVPLEYAMPGIKEVPMEGIVCSDDFSSPHLGNAWQWNHNPDDALWSLRERPGYLRLKTGRVVSHLFEAPNTLTQRTEGPRCTGTVRLDLSHMLAGDHAGLVAFCSQPGGLSVVRTADSYLLQMTDRGQCVSSQSCEATEIWLRMTCDFTNDTAFFSYSTDGKRFVNMGTPFHMIFSMDHFTGNKFAIFNYATLQTGGYIDVDSFEYRREE